MICLQLKLSEQLIGRAGPDAVVPGKYLRWREWATIVTGYSDFYGLSNFMREVNSMFSELVNDFSGQVAIGLRHVFKMC